MKEKIINHLKSILFLTIGIVLFMLFFYYPIKTNNLSSLQTNLLTVSGIVSGIMMAYLSTKIFSIKQERQNRQVEIDKISEKLNAYRRILFYITHSYGFWVRQSDIKHFKERYPNLTFAHINSQDFDNNEYSEYLADQSLSQTTIRLYLAMEVIVGDYENYEILNPLYSEKYLIEQLELYKWAANDIWYFLDGKYEKHTKGLIDETRIIENINKENVEKALMQIDKTYKNTELDRTILSEISSKLFFELYFPQLINLITLNTTPIKSLVEQFKKLTLIFFAGVILPILIQSLQIDSELSRVLTLISVTSVILLFINFLVDFYFLLNDEITID